MNPLYGSGMQNMYAPSTAVQMAEYLTADDVAALIRKRASESATKITYAKKAVRAAEAEAAKWEKLAESVL